MSASASVDATHTAQQLISYALPVVQANVRDELIKASHHNVRVASTAKLVTPLRLCRRELVVAHFQFDAKTTHAHALWL